MAVALQPQPDGGCGRRVSLGAVGHRHATRADVAGIDDIGNFVSGVRGVIDPKGRTVVNGYIFGGQSAFLRMLCEK